MALMNQRGPNKEFPGSAVAKCYGLHISCSFFTFSCLPLMSPIFGSAYLISERSILPFFPHCSVPFATTTYAIKRGRVALGKPNVIIGVNNCSLSLYRCVQNCLVLFLLLPRALACMLHPSAPPNKTSVSIRGVKTNNYLIMLLTLPTSNQVFCKMKAEMLLGSIDPSPPEETFPTRVNFRSRPPGACRRPSSPFCRRAGRQAGPAK